VREYANAVAEALSRTKLKRVPAYGTIRVKLVVSTDGELASIEILKSSGSRQLDAAVLAQVRRAKLPVPPPGLSLEERWFEFTYNYVP
jgi:TonB family protein